LEWPEGCHRIRLVRIEKHPAAARPSFAKKLLNTALGLLQPKVNIQTEALPTGNSGAHVLPQSDRFSKTQGSTFKPLAKEGSVLGSAPERTSRLHQTLRRVMSERLRVHGSRRWLVEEFATPPSQRACRRKEAGYNFSGGLFLV